MRKPAPLDGGVLGQDGDAALALLGVGIHGPLLHALVVAERAREAEHGVDQRGLAVVDVGHDGQVADRAGHVRSRTRWMRPSR